jgi:hypothetical protein
MTPVRSPKPINRRLFIRNIYATAASEQKEDDLNSSDPAISDARDNFEFTDENNSSNTVEAVPENPKPINRPVLFRNLFGTPVSEKKNEPGSSGPINHRGLFRNLFATAVSGEKEDDRGSSDLAVRVALGVSEKNQDAMAVSDVKEEDDPGISVPTYTVLVLSFSWWRVSGASN